MANTILKINLMYYNVAYLLLTKSYVSIMYNVMSNKLLFILLTVPLSYRIQNFKDIITISTKFLANQIKKNHTFTNQHNIVICSYVHTYTPFNQCNDKDAFQILYFTFF